MFIVKEGTIEPFVSFYNEMDTNEFINDVTNGIEVETSETRYTGSLDTQTLMTHALDSFQSLPGDVTKAVTVSLIDSSLRYNLKNIFADKPYIVKIKYKSFII